MLLSLVVITLFGVLIACAIQIPRTNHHRENMPAMETKVSPSLLVPIRPDFFDRDVQVYYINLTRRPDRNVNIQNELNKSSLLRSCGYERFEAIDGEHISLEPYRHLKLNLRHKKGEIGCALSHLLLWERCAQGRRPYLILEDDVVIPEYFDEVLRSSLPHVPAFDLLYLVTMNHAKRIPHNAYFDQLTRSNLLTGAYFVSPHGAKKLIDILLPYNPRRPIDGHLADLTASKEISSYIFRRMPVCIYQDYAESDIQRNPKNPAKRKRYYGEKRYNELDMIDFLLSFHLAQYEITWIPNPGNGGDSLIAAGTLQLFDALDLNYRIGDINKVYRHQVVFYGGGGNLVGLYKIGENFLRQALTPAHENIVVILPHTIKDCDALLEAIDQHPRTTVVCRDKFSYDYVRTSLSDADPPNLFLSDDMAFYLNVDRYRHKRSPASKRTLNYFRRDQEKTSLPLPRNNRDLSQDINIVPAMDNKKLVFKNAYKLLDEIDKYATVNTNRLHGAIGASLLNKRVHLYPNSYWKNQEVYNYSLRDNYPKTHFLITV